MSAVRAQVTLKTVDLDEGNWVTNVFAFENGSLANFEDEITPHIKTFYDALRPYMSGAITQLDHQIKWYDLPLVSPPNYPFAETSFGLATAPAGTQLPAEVATCLSFQGARVTGLPQRRRRGRIYLGPLNTTALGSSTQVGRPIPGMITAMTAAAAAFRSSVEAEGACYWGVWSTVDQALVEVTDGWMDNAFDTQRRRGLKETDRTVWP